MRKDLRFIFRQIILWLFLCISLYVLIKVAFPMQTKITFWEGDYALYWTTGRLNLLGGNPYSPNENLQLQKEENLISPSVESIAIMRYPPWIIPLISFCGLFSYPVSRLLWLILNVAVILLSSEQIWRLYEGPTHLRWISWLIGFSFAPSIFALGRGQITPLILMGLVGFLTFIEKPKKHWLAGVFLLFVSIKPHISYLFFIALALWVIDRRKWGVLLGSVVAILASLLIVMPFNPKIIEQYVSTPQVIPYTSFDTPTFGILFRKLFDPQNVKLQFIPPLLGSVWLLWYWTRHHSTWNWNKELPLLLLVSLSTAAFAWTYDQVILIFIGNIFFIQLILSKRNWSGILFLFIYFGINLGTVLLHRAFVDSWFVWLAPTWLVWFVVAKKILGKQVYEKKTLDNN